MMKYYSKILTSVIIFAVIILSGITVAISQQIQEPVTTDSRIRTLVFNPNEVYHLTFHYGYQSFVEFADDEEIELISLGEAFPWKVTSVQKRLFIRPLEINAHTNMTIITTKRTYQFDITSAEYRDGSSENLIYSVRFFYPPKKSDIPINNPQLPQPISSPIPQPMPMTIPGQLPMPPALQQPGGNKMLGGKISNDRNLLNFNYSIAGISENISPLKVYDDGVSTYFQFPDNNLIIPTISSVDLFGNEIPLQYRIDGKYVVVDIVNPQFSLRLSESLICVFNDFAF